jgi:hypothetical protein
MVHLGNLPEELRKRHAALAPLLLRPLGGFTKQEVSAHINELAGTRRFNRSQVTVACRIVVEQSLSTQNQIQGYRIMKAMLINAYDEDAKFQAADVENPEVKPGHVLVKIAASSVNTVDTMIRKMGKGLPLSPDAPAIFGMDFAGTIEAVGDGVKEFSVGDEVYGCAGGLADLPGTLAEFMVADSNLIAHKPKNLSMHESAALPLVAITAYEGLTRAGIKKAKKFWCMAVPAVWVMSLCNWRNISVPKSIPPVAVTNNWH